MLITSLNWFDTLIQSFRRSLQRGRRALNPSIYITCVSVEEVANGLRTFLYIRTTGFITKTGHRKKKLGSLSYTNPAKRQLEQGQLQIAWEGAFHHTNDESQGSIRSEFLHAACSTQRLSHLTNRHCMLGYSKCFRQPSRPHASTPSRSKTRALRSQGPATLLSCSPHRLPTTCEGLLQPS